MVSYSLEPDTRSKVYYYLTFLSLIATSASATLFTYLSRWIVSLLFATPSSIMIYFAMLWIFDSFLWHRVFINKVSRIPNLNGKWTGTITRKKSDGNLLPTTINCLIVQNWRSISIAIESENNILATARSVAIQIAHPTISEMRATFDFRMGEKNISEGFAILNYYKDDDILKGNYFSTIDFFGVIELNKVKNKPDKKRT